ncbi:hypothetical protein [Faecalicatena contorta]|uniref:Uncharacterized protein n=1 Tax=Faecalicatena contorta TaxID=39482 RepID=A0A315ZSM4_9FIRM|nr:hypothetical protein [Faecalicatena contorta]PWJ48545.1 hypothetical protein A8805_11166 [Faecalicatena contorta]SUQ15281.1 hypothetical protein SAMN05216529_11166 [Faecalicatena contorta]
MNQNMMEEVNEAIYAGERALSSLRTAQDELSSAKSWGIVDLLGGGLITDMIKHSKMDRASSYMETAKHDLRVFQRELKDVTVNADFQINVGDFLKFADFFFDGIVADYLVQSKIADAKKEVNKAIRQVEDILADLRSFSY